ncbi:MAG: hypothetical protein OXH04_18615 [Acidobacteria bacterium]|nr:hypothetical protein [Acidobacteriota bacterium]
MKTTVELSDDLALEAKRYAARHGMTLRAVIEPGIRSTLREEGGAVKPFTLRDASVDGTGLQAEFRDESWSRIREAAYVGGALTTRNPLVDGPAVLRPDQPPKRYLSAILRRRPLGSCVKPS